VGLALQTLAAAPVGAQLPAEPAPVEAAPDAGALAAAPAPRPTPGRDRIEAAWFEPADSLEARVGHTRRTALERGVWNLEAAALALLTSPRAPLEQAQQAVRLAPDLPAARMEFASALWLHGDSPLAAIRAAGDALAAFGRHPEGGLWLAGTLLALLAGGLIAGGLVCIAVVGAFAAPHAAHDLGDLFWRRLHGFGRAGVLASLVLLPAVLGQGLLGVAIALTAACAWRAGRGERRALVLAALAIVAGAHPVARLAGATLEALPSDPVARAALAASRGLVLPAELARLEAAADRDLLARQTLASLARRADRLGRADAMYQSLLPKRLEDPVVLTNAANVRLHLGHMEAALDLYQRALEVDRSALILYNLSQAYGRAFQVDDLTRTLEQAQALDGDLVADLTRLQGTQPEGFVVDLPLDNRALWERVVVLERGEAWAADLRAWIAPGVLGATPQAMVGAFAAALALGAVFDRRVRRSRWCARCGRRVCPRCHEVSGELCAPCHRLFFQPEETDRQLRLARIEALRGRERRLDRAAWAASLAVPGAAGVLARRPVRGLFGAICFCVAVAALIWRDGVVPDPLVAGSAGPFALASVAALAGLAYFVSVGASLAVRRRR
jgi:tetratricopeptide (TPR) repeat protein